MKLKFQAKKRDRLHRYFWQIHPVDRDLWWSDEKIKWVNLKDIGVKGGSTCFTCKTLRAFKRHIKNHPELHEKGAVLSNRFIGYNVALIGHV